MVAYIDLGRRLALMPKAIRLREEISGHSIIMKLAKSGKRIELRKFQISKLLGSSNRSRRKIAIKLEQNRIPLLAECPDLSSA
jgi:hypothetical protein